MNLLQSCSMLQALIVQKDEVSLIEALALACICIIYMYLLSSWHISCFLQRPRFPHLYGFEEDAKSVPNCLVSHLIFIHLKGYSSEMRFASYALRNGLVLKTMLISDLSLNQKDKWEKYLILKEFSDIPKGSANCQLKFDWVLSPVLKVSYFWSLHLIVWDKLVTFFALLCSVLSDDNADFTKKVALEV